LLPLRSKDVAENAPRWMEVAKITSKVLASTVAGAVGSLVIELALDAVMSINKLRDRGVDVLTVDRSQTRDLDAPIGDFRDKTLYVGHPALPKAYYPAAEFHRLTFETKFSEAIEILMALGATTLRVENITGWSKDFAVNLDVPIPIAGVPVGTQIGGGSGTGSSAASHLLYEAKLTGTDKPGLPENLIWYPHELTWQKVCQGRLEYGLQNFSLDVRYEEDFGVNANLNLAVEQVGLELGGNFEEHRATNWRIGGEFR